jgi:rhodanese-related sulfurtransferase
MVDRVRDAPARLGRKPAAVSRPRPITYHSGAAGRAAGAGGDLHSVERIPEFIGNHLFLVTLFVAILALLIWNLFGDALSGIEHLSPADATLLLNRQNAVVLDLRPKGDFESGHIIQALNVAADDQDAQQKILEKHKDRPIIAVCQNGVVSARQARSMRLKGFEKVHCLKGGLAAWRNAGLPLTRD